MIISRHFFVKFFSGFTAFSAAESDFAIVLIPFEEQNICVRVASHNRYFALYQGIVVSPSALLSSERLTPSGLSIAGMFKEVSVRYIILFNSFDKVKHDDRNCQ